MSGSKALNCSPVQAGSEQGVQCILMRPGLCADFPGAHRKGASDTAVVLDQQGDLSPFFLKWVHVSHSSFLWRDPWMLLVGSLLVFTCLGWDPFQLEGFALRIRSLLKLTRNVCTEETAVHIFYKTEF